MVIINLNKTTHFRCTLAKVKDLQLVAYTKSTCYKRYAFEANVLCYQFFFESDIFLSY